MTKKEVIVECSFEWNAGFQKKLWLLQTTFHQRDGGTHLLGFRSALTRIINKYAAEKNLNKKNKVTISGEDIKEGLTAILSVKMPDPNSLLKQKTN